MNPTLLWKALIGFSPAKLKAPAREPDYHRMREIMIKTQIESRDCHEPRVLEAMRSVPRHEFVPVRSRSRSYTDHPLPIGYDQTISQPYIVAFMTEQLDPQPTDRVLEIGTGSGYQAAVLSRLVREVFTIENVEPLAERAIADLERLGFDNIHVRIGNGHEGWPDHAPFDAIIVACAPDHVPEPLIAQLKEGGRMIIPVDRRGDQTLFLLEKRDGHIEQHAVLPVRFVPMTGVE